ncbi:MAG: ParB/Srx family N-terminal domain-containing protein [Hespellia sp.]|nr:ParB/Srx family N-terminal domain-containing protein [Hespellia sp.]
MKSFTMKLADMKKPEKNVRIHTDQQLREFERSVTMFGQIRPIVIDENNVILAGNGLYETLMRMGKTEAEVYQYLDLTENQKKKLMIADNKIFALGIENLETLNSFLDDLHDDLDIPGYDSEILRQMVAEAEDVTEKLSEYGTLDESEVQAIRSQTERREAKMEPQSDDSGSKEPEAPQNGTVIPTSEMIHEEEDEQTADIRKFVICPKCGEKIWL